MDRKLLEDLYTRCTPESTALLLIYIVEFVKSRLRLTGELTRRRLSSYCADIHLTAPANLLDVRNNLVHDVLSVQDLIESLDKVCISDVVIILKTFDVYADSDIIIDKLTVLTSWLKELNEKEDKGC